MMTFLVISDFILNATMLSNRHLLKQIVEAQQIIDTILLNKGWRNHPITRAWYFHVDALKYYSNCMLQEHLSRGFKTEKLKFYDIPKIIIQPWWTYWYRLHQSHRISLYKKDPFFYHDKFYIDMTFDPYGYIWPETPLPMRPEGLVVRKKIIVPRPSFHRDEASDDELIYPDDFITWENRNLPLEYITAPLAPALVNPVYCQAVIKSGKRKGETCNNLVKAPDKGMSKADKEYFYDKGRYEHPYCGVHRKRN